jgi:hypothetical protein
LVPEALEETEHRGMNQVCKDSIITWLRNSCVQVRREEDLIEATIAAVRKLFS